MTTAGVKVSEILEAARRGRALLAPEIAGYLVLGAADLLSRAPIWLDEDHCGLLVDGGRVVVAPAPAAATAMAERALRDLLQRLLEAAAGRAPALNAVAYGAAKGDVTRLISELESALIPVNRAAAGRALSRLARETVRARISSDAKSSAPPSPVERDGDDTQPMQVGELPVGESAAEPRAEPAAELDDDVLAGSDGPAPVRESPSVEPIVAALEDTGEPAQAEPEPGLPARPEPEPSEPAQSEPEPNEPTHGERARRSSGIAELLETSLSSHPVPPVEPPPAPEPAPSVVPVSPTPPPPSAPEVARASYASTSARGVDELIQDFMVATSRKEERVAHDLRRMTGSDPPTLPARAKPYDSQFQNSAGAAELYTSTPPPQMAQSVAPLPEDDPFHRRSTRRTVYVLLALVSFVTLGTVALLRLEPGFLSGRIPAVVEEERRAAADAAASVAARSAAGPCRATLVVTDVPQGAEVLVRSGLAPVDVERVPSGVRLEFVALYDGFAPKRGVVPRGVAWEGHSGKPRFDLPIQLEKSRVKAGALDAWPVAEPGSVVGGQGPPGTVHVVTGPRGAEVWMVAGRAPEAKLESLDCGAGLELMVAGTSRVQPYRRRLRVDASQLTPELSASTVTSRVSAQ